MPKDKGTPLMRQYMEVKNNYNDAIVLFRMGDFYETFNNDAKIVAKLNPPPKAKVVLDLYTDSGIPQKITIIDIKEYAIL